MRLIGAVARREPLPGYAIEAAAAGPDGAAGPVFGTLETWRGPRFEVLVVEIPDRMLVGETPGGPLSGGPGDAAAVAARLGPGIAAAWLAGPGTGPSGGRNRGDGARASRAGVRGDFAMTAQGTAGRAGGIDGESRKVRNRQIVLFSSIAAALMLVFAVWMGFGGGKAPAPGARIDAELAGPGTAEDSWTRRSEGRLGLIETRLREMETRARQLTSENERLRGQLKDNDRNARDVIDKYKAVIDEMQAGTPAPAQTPNMVPDGEMFSPGGAVRQSAAGTANAPAGAPPAPLIENFTLDGAAPALLGDDPGTVDAKPLSIWLPAGSHAEAVVLAGVDASAGISSQGDPRPVLLRLTGPAWTAAPSAAAGTALSVDIAGCTVTGAAHGDLSSEKIYARLRTLTCAGARARHGGRDRGRGLRRGARARPGVRGPVVSREGALVQKAFLAGLVSGVGQGVAGAFQPQAVATGGAAVGQYRAGRYRPRRPRVGRSQRRAEGCRLHDPPRRAVPAGGSSCAPGPASPWCSSKARASTARPPDRPPERRNRMTHSIRPWRGPRVVAGAAVLAALAGCSSTHVGESWQCPLAQGGIVHERRRRRSGGAGARRRSDGPARAALPGARRRKPGARSGGGAGPKDPAIANAAPSPGWRGCSARIRKPAMIRPARNPPRRYPRSGPGAALPASTGERPAGDRQVDKGSVNEAPVHDDPAPGDTAAIEAAAMDTPGDDLREAEIVGRIWIAPFVDGDGIYREAGWVRLVIAPARWRLP